MARRAATRRASSTAESEQHPPWRAASSESSRGHCCSVTPTTSCPCAWSSAAATDESTPPDIATATLMSFPSPLGGEGQGGGIQSSLAILRDVLRHQLGVLAHTVEDRRLELAHPVHTREVQAGNVRGAVSLDGKSHLVEDRQFHPPVIRTVTARPDDRADAIFHDVELQASLDAQGLGPPEIRRPLPAGCAVRLYVLPQVGEPRVAEVGACREVVRKADLVAVRTGKVAEQLNSHQMESAKV